MRSRITGGCHATRNRVGWQQRAAQVIGFLLAAVLLVSSGRAGAVPVGPDPKQATGCCVCRGTRGGEQQSIRSCADGVKVEACVAACHTQGGASIGFGYQQTCSQNCAGFPTQH